MAISRRLALQAAVGTGVVALIPASQYARWATDDRSRAGFGASVMPSQPPAVKWSNWSGIQTSNPQRIAAPDTEQALANLLAATDGPIRPVGSGHSFSALVTSDGTIIDVGQFAGLIASDQSTQTARIGAGTRLRHGARLLSDVGLGMQNLPDIDVQTFAGSFATATHGTGATLHAIHDHVVGFRLVTPSGEALNVSRQADPDLFEAGKVSLGALGIITEYTLQLEQTYNLRRQLYIRPKEEILAGAERKFAEHRHYEFFYTPNAPLAAEVVHEKFNEPLDGIQEETDSNELLDVLKGLRDHLGWSGWLRKQAVFQLFPRGLVEDVKDEYWKMLTSTRPGKFNEIEYHLPADVGLAAVREVAAVLDSNPANYYPMEVRKTAGDTAWMSPFEGADRISVAVHANHEESYDFFFTEIEPIFRRYGGRPHWGKLHSLGRQELADLYPRFDAFREIQRRLDPAGKMLNPHLKKILEG